MNKKDERINKILSEVEKKTRGLFGEKIKKIILFGSYARGDFNPDSDVDILIVVEDDDLRLYRKARVKIISEFLNKYNILLSIRIVSNKSFSRYKMISPFYQNVIKEGIILYG